MLLVYDSVNTMQDRRGGPSMNFGLHALPLSSENSSSNIPNTLNWASVASWIFRPECSPMMSIPKTNQTLPNCTSSARVNSTSPKLSNPLTSTANSASPARHLEHPLHSEREEQQNTSENNRGFQLPTICSAIRCTVPSCNCDGFVPGKKHLRYCESCKHGWVPHALDKLGTRHLFTNSAPEPVQLDVVFDIASLVLYGCQALPIRLKILLDRLFSALQKDQVVRVLHGFGWTLDDYARGYILQETCSGRLDRWSICSPEEEPLVLQQFLRFEETRLITQQLMLAQQVLQETALDRLDYRSALNSRRPMSPNRHPSPPAFPPSTFLPAHLLPLSPHKQSLKFFNLPTTNGSQLSTPPPENNNSSPLNTSPLNRLQSMQPFDFRKLGAGLPGFNACSPPDLARRKVTEAEVFSGLNLSMSSALSMCPPPIPTSTLIPSSVNHPSSPAMVATVSASSVTAPSLVPSSFSGLASSIESKSVTSNSEIGSEDDDNDNTQSVLNLSRDKDPVKVAPRVPRTSSIPGRKPTLPSKRQWGSPALPLNLGTQFINPTTGKKRVQCNVCLKTFCDKGALKIHFSAVHLREMHKCTVEGCNMMFSSRRSRNRHSANPNPKLHSPHLRRKISPHDGRSAQAHPILIPSQTGLPLPTSALNALNPFGAFPLLTPPPDIRHHSALAALDFKHSLDLSLHRSIISDEIRKEHKEKTNSEEYALELTTNRQNEENDDDYDDGIIVVGGEEEEESEKNEPSNEEPDRQEYFALTLKKQKMSVSDVDEDLVSNVDSNDDSLSLVDTHSYKGDSNAPTNKRKRKSQNPTKCTAPMIIDNDVSDGESSDNIFARDTSKEQLKPLNDVDDNEERTEKRETPKPLDSPLNLGKHSRNSPNETETPINSEIKTSLAPLYHSDKIKKEKNLGEGENTEHYERPESSIESNRSDESFDSSNALRHLESLSHGNFGELLSRGLPPGFNSQTTNLSPLSLSVGGGPPSPARSQASSTSNSGESMDENSQNYFGHFDNGQFISTMDVPIDKDNPRKCTACGKIFQNHFGVKTHYQNVHLKLMHKCNVDGCNAAFPSKRSRDRHSANLNLHRKLLSTTTEKTVASLLLEKSSFNPLSNSQIPNDFFTRFYIEEAMKPHNLANPGNFDQMLLNGDRIPPPPFLIPPLGNLPFPLGGLNSLKQFNGAAPLSKDQSSASSSPILSPPPSYVTCNFSELVHCIEEDLPTPDKEGNLPCKLCKTSFKSAMQLKEHCEQNHLLEMCRCTNKGCPKVFLSRTKRNVHSERELQNMQNKDEDRKST
ncbi:zinc finger protein basonuclin-2 isoform X2 [Agrilus planipennis]|uniref:Zinc finger protein basonuclin-2 isoform X2 n=1 Tax=Agrilus planipennis TaxID=224129 RepID=A0A7F5RMZ8_AGRPL|nr:zinc finger protein basonuclin-2 isoform X2 [Agrilus planipennis]